MDNYIYISSRRKKEKYINDNFSNSIFIKSNPSKSKLNSLLEVIKASDAKTIILEDYFIGINEFIEELNKLKLIIKFVWTNGLGTLNEEIELGNLQYVIELLNNKKIKEVYFTEENTYLAFKSLKGVHRLLLTVKDNNEEVCYDGNSVGILGDTYDWRSNNYNQISAIKLLDGYRVNGFKIKRLFKKFTKLFNIELKNYKCLGELINNSNIISCIEFSPLFTFEIMESFNKGVPCIVGNNISIFKNTDLEKLVVVKSDDSINEIAEKLKNGIKNKKKIIKLYKKIKKEYDLESAKSINKLIGG